MKPKFDSLKFCVISIIDNLFLVLVFLALFGLFKILHIFFNIQVQENMQNLEIFKEIQKISKEINELTSEAIEDKQIETFDEISKEINELTGILKNFTEILIFNIERVYRGYDEI